MSKICKKCGKVNDDITIICTKCFSFFEEKEVKETKEKINIEAKLNTKNYRKDISITMPRPKEKQKDYKSLNYDHLFSVLDNKIIGHKKFSISKQKEIEKIREQSIDEYLKLTDSVNSINNAIDDLNKEVKDYSKELYENRKRIIKEEEEKARQANALVEEIKSEEFVEIKESIEIKENVNDEKLLDEIKEKIDINIANENTNEENVSAEDNDELSLDEIEKLINETDVVVENETIKTSNNEINNIESKLEIDIEKVLSIDPIMDLEVDMICAIGRVESIIQNNISKEEAILEIRNSIPLEPKKYDEVTFVEKEPFEGEIEDNKEEKKDIEEEYKEIKEEEYEEIKEEEKIEEKEEVDEKGEYVYEEELEEDKQQQEEENKYNYKLENIFIEEENDEQQSDDQEEIEKCEEVVEEEIIGEKENNESAEINNEEEIVDTEEDKEKVIIEDEKENIAEEKEIENAINEYYSKDEDIENESNDNEVYYQYDDTLSLSDISSNKTAEQVDEEDTTTININNNKKITKKKNRSKGFSIFIRVLIVVIIVGVCGFGVFGLRKVLNVYSLDEEINSLDISKDLSRKEMHRILSIEGYSPNDIDSAIKNAGVDFYYNALNVAYNLAKDLDNINGKKAIESYLTDRGFSDDEVDYVMDNVDWAGFLKDNLDIFLNEETIYNKRDIISKYRKAGYSEDEINKLDRYDVWYQFAVKNASFYIKKETSYDYDELITYLFDLGYTDTEIDKALTVLGVTD